MKKFILFSLIFLVIPFATAADCGLTNLANCLPEKLIEFAVIMFNAPIEGLLQQIQQFLTEPVNIEQFQSLWQLIIYILSIFYGILLLFAGYNFIVSGQDPVRREMAKEWIKNIIFLIIFVQASFFLYKVLIEVGASLSAGVMNLVDPSFFLITANSIADIGLQFLFSVGYITALFNTIILLFIRYFLVNIGLLLFPIGLFLYFIPPLRSYGKLIVEGLIILILLPFFQSLILLMGSKLLELSIVENLKILVMMCSFILFNLIMIFLILFVAFKAINQVGGIVTSIGSAIKTFV